MVLKCNVSPSIGSSSSASSSDDEIKEAFESYKQRLVPLSAAVPSWNSRDMWGPVYPKTMDPISSRPLRVVPSGHRKPKFFAQMSATPSERPYLDFNKMQHSKRVLMVRIWMSVWLSCTAVLFNLYPLLVNNIQILDNVIIQPAYPTTGSKTHRHQTQLQSTCYACE